MINRIELKINKKLKEGVSLRDLSKDLVKDLFSKSKDLKLSSDEKKSCLFFPVYCGFQRELFSQFPQWIRKKRFFPWGCFLKILNDDEIIPESNHFDALFEGAEKNGNLEVVSVARNWDKLDPRFYYLRKEVLKNRQKKLDQLYQDIKEKLDFFKTQRILNEERKVLDLYFRLFPNDPELEVLERDYEIRWVADVLLNSKVSSSYEREMEKFKKNFDMASGKESQILFLKEEVLSIFKRIAFKKKRNDVQAQCVADFAMMFFFMDEYDSALEILEKEKQFFQNEWLQLELLYLSKKYFECLEEIERIENRWAEEPDSSFACSYLKAQSYWQIGQGEIAIKLMENLIRVRPNYRSAHSLLLLWKGQI